MTMETVQANLKVTNKAEFQHFTVQNLPQVFIPIRVRTVKRSGRLTPVRLPRASRIRHKPERLVC